MLGQSLTFCAPMVAAIDWEAPSITLTGTVKLIRGIRPVTLYRYVDPNGNLRDYGKRVIRA